MIPPTSAPIDEDSGKNIVQTIKEGGFTASLIGIAGMVARLLLSEQRISFGGAVRHVFAAGIVSYFVDQGLSEQAMPHGLRIASIGISGATAVEIVEFIVRWIKAKGEKEIGNISIKRKKTNVRKKR